MSWLNPENHFFGYKEPVNSVQFDGRALNVNQNWEDSSPERAWFWRGLAFSRWGMYSEVVANCSETESALSQTLSLEN
ncbi:hypothetical protein ACL6C3_13075 [Capilliphycus salinus ALCB114379]|uniref:hypothetical protein n=1 Tax=Capilliphycus salinus TaxID=2768948 RepID=UPI0039A55BED